MLRSFFSIHGISPHILFLALHTPSSHLIVFKMKQIKEMLMTWTSTCTIGPNQRCGPDYRISTNREAQGGSGDAM